MLKKFLLLYGTSAFVKVEVIFLTKRYKNPYSREDVIAFAVFNLSWQQ